MEYFERSDTPHRANNSPESFISSVSEWIMKGLDRYFHYHQFQYKLWRRVPRVHCWDCLLGFEEWREEAAAISLLLLSWRTEVRVERVVERISDLAVLTGSCEVIRWEGTIMCGLGPGSERLDDSEYSSVAAYPGSQHREQIGRLQSMVKISSNLEEFKREGKGRFKKYIKFI